MKRIIKIGLLMLVLSFGFSKKSDAVQQVCYDWVGTCGYGTSYSFTVCGDSVDECVNKAIRAMTAICGEF